MGKVPFRLLVRADLLRLGSASGWRLWCKLMHPRFVPVLLIRLTQFCYTYPIFRPISFFFSMSNIFFFGLEVTPRCRIGEGLLIPHTSGTVIGAVEIGRNVTIFQGVTLGAKFADIAFSPEARPVIGDDVIIGSGAKILGGISIGNRSVVASNSLLLESIPEDALAIGVPAIIEKRKS